MPETTVERYWARTGWIRILNRVLFLGKAPRLDIHAGAKVQPGVCGALAAVFLCVSLVADARPPPGDSARADVVSPCTPTGLSGEASLFLSTANGYHTEAYVGEIALTNTSESSCSLEGTPHVHVIDAHKNVLPVTEENLARLPAGVRAIVDLGSGEKAIVGMIWRNFCALPTPPGPFSLVMTIPNGGTLDVPATFDKPGSTVRLDSSPPCLARGSGSVLGVGAFTSLRPNGTPTPTTTAFSISH